MAKPTRVEVNPQLLFAALELSSSTWVVAMSDRHGIKICWERLDAGDVDGLMAVFAKAKRKLGLPATAGVKCCYEAGRDGFWLHRALVARGVQNVVLDPASIEVPRNRRHAKTDRLDAAKLLALLLRLERGERAARLVRIPTVQEEDRRHLHRERDKVKAAFTSVTNQIGGLLATQGITLGGTKLTAENIDALERFDGVALEPQLRNRLKRLVATKTHLQGQLSSIDSEMRAVLKEAARVADEAGDADEVPVDNALQLHQLKGIGYQGAIILAREMFDWRDFQNRRQVGGFTGLVAVPHLSGAGGHTEGISKVGSGRIRKLLVEQAWSWVRHQPDSAMTRWFLDRFGNGKRTRKIGIVALARKLVVAMWRYLKFGVIPEGAVLRAQG